MPHAKSLCGAETKSSGTCRNPVPRPGVRCRLHRPLASAPELFRLSVASANAVIKTIGAGIAAKEAIELYEFVAPYLHQFGSLLAPEDFWVQFRGRNLAGMQAELLRAREQKQGAITQRFKALKPRERRAVAEAYGLIMAKCSYLESAA